jgi:hypothetical protein
MFDEWRNPVLYWLQWPALIALVIFGMVKCSQWDDSRPSTIAARAAEAAQAKAEATPHVIREADGCKVYAFKAGDRYHYFTRCPGSSTTTESSWTERHGKSSVTKTETIESN